MAAPKKFEAFAPNQLWVADLTYIRTHACWVYDWFNHRRLHGEIGLVPPVEFETTHWTTPAVTHYVEQRVPEGTDSR
jgi:hypothetical protein